MRDRLHRATAEYVVAVVLWAGTFLAVNLEAPGAVFWPLFGTATVAIGACLAEIVMLHR